MRLPRNGCSIKVLMPRHKTCMARQLRGWQLEIDTGLLRYSYSKTVWKVRKKRVPDGAKEFRISFISIYRESCRSTGRYLIVSVVAQGTSRIQYLPMYPTFLFSFLLFMSSRTCSIKVGQ